MVFQREDVGMWHAPYLYYIPLFVSFITAHVLLVTAQMAHTLGTDKQSALNTQFTVSEYFIGSVHHFLSVLQQHGLFKARQSRNPYKIGTAERKVLIVFVYYVILTVISLTAFTLIVQDADRLSSALLRYFECESKGVDPNNPCDPNTYIKLQHVAVISLSYILLGLFPVVNFVFVISV